jgi:hypothetical protein
MRIWILLLGITCLLSACSKAPDYPDMPVISLYSWQFYPSTIQTNLSLDKLIVKIHFTDGNGDLGLVPTDTVDPVFKKYIGTDKTRINPRYYNFYFAVFAENQFGRYDSTQSSYADAARTILDRQSGYGSFAPTEDMQLGQPIQGYIQYTFTDFLVYVNGDSPQGNRGRIRKGKKYFAKIRICDRAGNMSNQIITDTLVY